MNKFLKAAAILLSTFAGVCQLSAQTANIGKITLSAPNFGYQTVGVYNYTGPVDGCKQLASQYNVCNAVSITSWQLTIAFAANASGLAPSPLVFTSNGSNDAIAPTNANNDAYTGQAANPWTLSFNLQNAGCNPTCDAQISSITFSGAIDTGSLNLYDSSATGPYILDSLASQNFSVTWTIPATDYTTTPGALFDTTDILVTNQAPLQPQTITFNALSDLVLGTTPPALSATATSGLDVKFTSNSASVCTVAETAITLVSAGVCSITASQAGNTTYAAATPVTQMFNVTQAAQTITFGPLSDLNRKATPPALSATASSGLDVAFASNSESVCTVSDTTITLVAAGTCSITASQAGDTTYSAAPPVTQTFTVSLAPQTITFGPLSNVLLSAGTVNVSATATSNLDVAFTSGSESVCKVSDMTVTLVSAGVCSLTASQPGDTTYAAAETVTQTFKVQNEQTITFAPISDIVISATPPALSATASSTLAVTFTSTTESICTVSDTAVRLVAAGSCSIKATQEGNDLYAAAPSVTRTFAVTLEPQTITFNSIESQALGASLTLTATASSNLKVSFASNSETICTVADGAVTLLKIGTCSITASQDGDGTWAAAATVTQTFTVTLKPQTITFGPIDTILLTATPPPLSATATSGLDVSFESTTGTICTVSDKTVTLVATGTCAIKATQAGDTTTWAAATAVTQSFLITTLTPQTITFNPIPAQTIGVAVPALSATASSHLKVNFASNSQTICQVSDTAITLVQIGVCSITASQGGDGTYAAATPITQEFAVNGIPQTITFNAIPAQTLGTAPPALSATATSTLKVTFTSDTQAVCTVSDTALTLVSAGSCSITASQPGDSTHAAAAAVNQIFAVNLRPQTITFAPIQTIMLNATPPALSASASSGLDVSFASTTGSVCGVSGTAVTLSTVGVCTIQATQGGNTTMWAAATPVTQSFLVTTLTPQTITFGPLSSVAFGTTAPALSATASSGLPVLFASGSSGVCLVSDSGIALVSVGVCSVTASQAGNDVYAAATSVTQMFTVTQGANIITFNPASSLTLGNTPPALSATASSGLAVQFASITGSVCSVSETTLTLLTTGTCTITASQDGNANYSAAAAVTKSITINPASTGGGGGNGGGGGTGGGGTLLTVAPLSVTIDTAAGSAPGTAQITLSYPTFTQGAPNFSTNFNTNQGQGWLSISPATGAMTLGSTSGLQFIYTATLTISADPVTLTAGNTYTGTVHVNANGSIVNIPVTANVSSTPAKYTTLPESLTFSYQLGSPATPASQNISVFSTPLGGGYTVSAASSGGGGSWLSAAADSATPVTPGVVSVAVNTSGFTQAGQFSGAVTIHAGASSIEVPVTLDVTAAAEPPVLSVSPAQETFSIQQGGAATGGQVTVSNTGGGTLTFSASAASTGGWLTLNSSAAATATPSSPASLGFTIDPKNLTPGVYNGKVTVTDTQSAATGSTIVVLTITGAKPQIQLSRTGLNLAGVAGGSHTDDETVIVSNTGGGTLAWKASASTHSGGNWLRVSPAAGSLDAGAAGSAVTISADPSKLKAGNYSGSINFTAQGATNSPQTVSVRLTVSASQPYPAVRVFSGGAILLGRSGDSAPAQTSISMFNRASTAIRFSARTSASWLSVSPSSGSLDPGSGSVTISADLGSFSGLRLGTVSLGFEDGSGATIRVLALALPNFGARGRTGASAQLARPMASLAACPGGTASFLIPVFEQPFSGSTVEVSSAADVKVQVIDDCGNAVTAASGGSVQMTFSNGDPGINLADTGGGVWEATWIPANAAAQVTLQVVASQNGLTSGADADIETSETVTVAAAAAGAAPQATGIANAASAGQAIPSIVTPGSYVAIYGTNLAGSGNPNATPGQPLPVTLNGAQVTLGGLPMPLLYAAAGQVNAVVPQGIAPNAAYPLVVVNGTSQSVPVPLTVTELQPGTYTVNTTGSGAGIVTDASTGQLITASNPAHAGQNLVIYMTGLGSLLGANGEQQPADGAIAPTSTIYHTTSKVAVTIGGVSATTVQFAGLTPTLTALYQVNVQMPDGVTPGSAVPVVVTAADSTTGVTAVSNTVTIAVQ
jgi:uncharacterized protein (TIGR03437 family)